MTNITIIINDNQVKYQVSSRINSGVTELELEIARKIINELNRIGLEYNSYSSRMYKDVTPDTFK